MSNKETTDFVKSSPYYQYGWICPKCGSVYSPTTSFCYKCSGNPDQYKITCTCCGGNYTTIAGNNINEK